MPQTCFIRCPPPSPFPPLPRYFCVGASLDPDKRPGVASGLCVMGLEQVLSDHGQFKIADEAPTEPYICGCVTFDELGRPRADVTKGLIKFQALSEIQRRLDHHLVVWACALG